MHNRAIQIDFIDQEIRESVQQQGHRSQNKLERPREQEEREAADRCLMMAENGLTVASMYSVTPTRASFGSPNKRSIRSALVISVSRRARFVGGSSSDIVERLAQSLCLRLLHLLGLLCDCCVSRYCLRLPCRCDRQDLRTEIVKSEE